MNKSVKDKTNKITIKAPRVPEVIKARTFETFDLQKAAERRLDELEAGVKSGQCSPGFALARAFEAGVTFSEKSVATKAKAEAV